MFSRLLLLLSSVGAVFTGIKVSGQVSSNFSTGTEGWTAPAAVGGLIAHNASGGNPGGFVQASPSFNPGGIAAPFPLYFYFISPAAFHGNLSAYFNGSLTFDLQQAFFTGSGVQKAEVVITDGTNTIYYFPSLPFNPAQTPAWTTYTVALSTLGGFWKSVNSSTGPAATALQIQTVLTNVTTVAISGRFNTVLSPGATGLDNVLLLPPITITTQPTGVAACIGQIATLTTVAAGNPGLSYRWQLFDTGTGGYNDISDTGGYSGTATSTLNINTTGAFGAGSYRCRVSGLYATDAFTTTVVVTTNTPPAAPTTTGAFRCDAGPLTLTASGGTTGQYRWYTVPSGGTPIAGQFNGSYTTPSLPTSVTYYAAIDNGTCESSRTAVTASIIILPPPAATGAFRCDPGPITLSASGGASGQYRWYTVPTGGTPIPGQFNSTYTTPPVSASTNYYVSINTGTCESNRTLVVAAISTASDPSVTGASRCGTGSVVLTASGASNGQYRWYNVPSGGAAIIGEVNGAFTTPSLSASTTFYASINNGFCESNRVAVTATVNVATKPTINSTVAPVSGTVTICQGQSTILAGPAGFSGYTWSSGQSTSQITVTAAGTFTLVVTDASACQSVASDPMVIIVQNCGTNLPPVIDTPPLATQIEGKVTLGLSQFISDPDDNLDLSTLDITKQPKSGATASIDANFNLVLNYSGISFSGIDELEIEVCDLAGSCTTHNIAVEVVGDIIVNNGFSPNGDGINDFFELTYIELLEGTKQNHVRIYNRWGDLVFEIDNYNNSTRVFRGLNNNGNELASGTYYYKIDFKGKTLSGYLILKR